MTNLISPSLEIQSPFPNQHSHLTGSRRRQSIELESRFLQPHQPAESYGGGGGAILQATTISQGSPFKYHDFQREYFVLKDENL